MTDRTNSPEWREDCALWRGRVLSGKLSHWCYDWDGLPVDETTHEIAHCHCFNGTELEAEARAAGIKAEDRFNREYEKARESR